MTLDEVDQSIKQLRIGMDAAAVDLIDRHAGQSLELAPSLVAESLAKLPCLAVAWREWYRALEVAGDKTQTCSCGDRHQLHGTVLDKRWALAMVVRDLVVGDGSFVPAKALAYVEGVSLVRFFLEERQSDRRAASGGQSGGSPAELAIPVSWHRKARS
jgi:hypothetical protein